MRAALARVALLAAVLCGACGDDDGGGAARYPYPANHLRCEQAPGPSGSAFLHTSGGLAVLVRTPANHQSRFRHPLLVVYAGAGMSPLGMERLTRLTPVATAAGFVVAYAQHIRPSRSGIGKLAAVPALVGANYCINPKRIYLTGHSDGGTAAIALVLEGAAPFHIRGIAPSAAGFRAEDLAGFQCPAPLPVRIAHGARDSLFPGWGREAWRWWSRCNECDLQQAAVRRGRCLVHPACTAPAYYCETDAGHTRWPEGQEHAIVEFFARP